MKKPASPEIVVPKEQGIVIHQLKQKMDFLRTNLVCLAIRGHVAPKGEPLNGTWGMLADDLGVNAKTLRDGTKGEKSQINPRIEARLAEICKFAINWPSWNDQSDTSKKNVANSTRKDTAEYFIRKYCEKNDLPNTATAMPSPDDPQWKIERQLTGDYELQRHLCALYVYSPQGAGACISAEMTFQEAYIDAIERRGTIRRAMLEADLQGAEAKSISFIAEMAIEALQATQNDKELAIRVGGRRNYLSWEMHWRGDKLYCDLSPLLAFNQLEKYNKLKFIVTAHSADVEIFIEGDSSGSIAKERITKVLWERANANVVNGRVTLCNHTVSFHHPNGEGMK